MTAIPFSPTLAHKHTSSTASSHGGRKRKLSNKWFLDGYLYADLPMQGVARLEENQTDHDAFAADPCPSVTYVCEDDQSSLHTLSSQYATSPSSMTCDSEEHKSVASNTGTAISRPSNQQREKDVTLRASKELWPQRVSSACASCPPLRPNTSSFSEPQTPTRTVHTSHQRHQAFLAHESSEPHPMLWPLPPGDPVLPPCLQAVPYPTSPVVRPPLSSMSPYQQRQYPGLPPISQLMDAVPMDTPPIFDDTQSCTTSYVDEHMIDEGYEEGHEYPGMDQASVSESDASETPTTLMYNNIRDAPVVNRPYGTPVVTDEGWCVGLMRLHRERRAHPVEWQHGGRAQQGRYRD